MEVRIHGTAPGSGCKVPLLGLQSITSSDLSAGDCRMLKS